MTTPVSEGGRCVRCGYDLAGLPSDASCPECGVAVLRSRHGDLLVFADPAVLRPVRTGLGILLPVCFLGGLLSLAGMIAGAPPLVGQVPYWLWGYVFSPAWLLLAIAETVGWWLTTTADPGQESRTGSLRLGVRLAAIAAMFAAGLATLLSAVLPPDAWVGMIWPWIDRSADLLLFIVGTHYLRRLAQRAGPSGPAGLTTALLASGVFVRLAGASRSGWYLAVRLGMNRGSEFFNLLAWAGVAQGLAMAAVAALQCIVLFTLLARVNAAMAAHRPAR